MIPWQDTKIDLAPKWPYSVHGAIKSYLTKTCVFNYSNIFLQQAVCSYWWSTERRNEEGEEKTSGTIAPHQEKPGEATYHPTSQEEAKEGERNSNQGIEGKT